MQEVDRTELARPTALRFPRRFQGWLPFLWRNILFPGREPDTEPVRFGAVFLLLVIPAVLLYPGMGIHLFEPDEGRYAEIPREMLLRGEWVVPYLEGEPYLDKPPLLYWLVSLSYRLFGVHDWSARLVPALAVHGCVLLTYGLGRRILGEWAAFWGALLLSLAPGFMSMGRLLILDGLLAFWVLLAWMAAYEAVRGCHTNPRRRQSPWPALRVQMKLPSPAGGDRISSCGVGRLRYGWWLVAAVACGLGILTKGPVALLLLAPPLWAYRRWRGKACRIGWRALLVFVAALLIVTLPWYVAICFRLPAFAGHFFWQHNVLRFLVPFDHLRPIWFYGPVLLVGLLPATLWLAPFVRFLISPDPAVCERRCPGLGFMLLSGGWCILFFSLSGCKLPTYILPAFPPLALALGYYLVASGWIASAWPRVMALLFFCILFAGHNFVLPWYAGYRAPSAHLKELKDYCGDLQTPVVCYPRNCDSAAFYIGRDDFRSYRSKDTNGLVRFLQHQPRTVLLLTHRHSLQGLGYALTSDLEIVDVRHLGLSAIPGLSENLTDKLTWFMGETSLGLCDIVVVERREKKP